MRNYGDVDAFLEKEKAQREKISLAAAANNEDYWDKKSEAEMTESKQKISNLGYG